VVGLGAAQAGELTIRTDNLGFEVRNIAENFAFIVVS
jgi:hypothetical protein